MVIYYFIYVNGTQYQMYYRILLIEIIATCFDISWYFQGMEDFKKTVFRNTLVKFVSIALIFLLVKKPEDLAKYFIIYVVSNFVGNISLWLYIPKFLDRIKIKELQPLRHLRATIGLFIPQIAIQIYTLLDKVMIGVIIDDKSEVGYYPQSFCRADSRACHHLRILQVEGERGDQGIEADEAECWRDAFGS